MRSLASLEKQGLIERVQVQLRWRRKPKTRKALASELV
jgi:hypothetical protein